MSKKTIYYIIGAAILIIGTLITLSKKGIIGNKDQGKAIEITNVNATTIIETVSATGKIQPEIEVKISSEVSGEIISLNVKEGQVVKKGDLLVKINPDLYTSGYNRSVSNLSGTKAGLSQADAQFKESKSNYDRSKTLYDKGIISKSDWDKSVASFEVAKATKQSAYYTVQSASAKSTLERSIMNVDSFFASRCNRQTPSIAFSIVDLPQFEPERLRYFVRSIQQQITLALHESGELRLTDASIQGD